MKKIKFNNEMEMPLIGIGTWPMKGLTLLKAITYAFKSGYKKIDTASAYSNEKWIGLALKLNFKRRKDVFITTKLSNTSQRDGDIRKAFNVSLKRLGVKYVDLYLMHWPNPDTFIKSWKEMEKLYEEGLVKAIGVCNFQEHHLEELLKVAKIIPVINQVERHPLLSQKKLIEYCKNKKIIVEAYSPFARMDKKLIENETLVEISKKYNKEVTQIILRWNYQNDIPTVPKSSNKERIKQNIDILDFELKDCEMDKINLLNENYRVRHNPDNCDFTKL
ncbi:aldo/keto reductase [Psychrilyobacter sp.]|uniref:aldo/keto reductase n=1 Tax=Psychrilyobacter sp. TaxID=2586924 RepID=UPI003017C0CC